MLGHPQDQREETAGGEARVSSFLRIPYVCMPFEFYSLLDSFQIRKNCPSCPLGSHFVLSSFTVSNGVWDARDGEPVISGIHEAQRPWNAPCPPLVDWVHRFTQSDTHPGSHGECAHGNSGETWVLSHPLYFPMPTTQQISCLVLIHGHK